MGSHHTTVSCPFGRYRYLQLLFGVAPVGDIFQRKIHELLQGLPNVFGIADDILIAGFNKMGRGYNSTFNRVLKICRQVSLKCNKEKCLFRGTGIPSFGEVILQ